MKGVGGRGSKLVETTRQRKKKTYKRQDKREEKKGGRRKLLNSEPVLLNVYGAPELIPRNEFRQPM